jgi:hypothetical protein
MQWQVWIDTRLGWVPLEGPQDTWLNAWSNAQAAQTLTGQRVTIRRVGEEESLCE